jgi:hypothetical protein
LTMHARLTALAASALAGLSFAAAASATTYDFSTAPSGEVTPLTLDGATFSSPSDPGAFTISSSDGLYTTLGSTVLSSAGYPYTLDISFVQAQTGISFNFATGDGFAANGGDGLILTTNTGLTEMATPSLQGSPDLGIYPQGLFSLAGASPFTSVTIEAYDAAGEESLAIGNLTSTPAVPLPGALVLFASGLAALGARVRRSRES